MKCYCYRCNRCGAKSERWSHRPELGVSCQCGGELRRDYKGEHEVSDRSGRWPLVSEAAAIEPGDVPAVQGRMKAAGIDCQFDGEGRPSFENPSHRKKCLKFFGLVDKNAYY